MISNNCLVWRHFTSEFFEDCLLRFLNGIFFETRINYNPRLKFLEGYSCSSTLGCSHREITLIELQSLVVFGCAALLFMVGATASTHDREEGWDDFLFVYTE